MTLAERGLLASMRWAVWANDSLPRDPAKLSRLLGSSVEEVRQALTPAVLSFFAHCEHDADRLYSPELAAQMQRLLDYRAERSESGRKGGKSTQLQRRAQPKAQLESQPEARRKLTEKSRDEKNRNELGKAGDDVSAFVRDYERGERAQL